MAAELLQNDPHDQQLLDHVRPANWKNPAPKPLYDLIVLGAGAGGLVSAAAAAGVGARVALIEKHLLGGECLNVGCVPSKALVRSARAVADARRAGEFGVRVNGVTVDFSAIMERMRGMRAALAPNDSADRFQRLGIDVFLGEGRFTSTRTLKVDGHSLRFRKALVATGSRPAIPNVPGLSSSGYLTNESLFNQTELPARLAILGAGAMGCEMAQAFARFGSRVTLFAKEGQILPKEDPQASAIVRKSLVRDGVAILDSSLANFEGQSFDRILLATGRVPNVQGLGLEEAGIAFDVKDGIVVNDRLQTTNRRIFAVGDVATSQRFTHAADAMARLAVRNALFFGRGKFSTVVIPHCTFTEPELASVGRTAETSEILAITVPFTEVDRAVLEGETEGFFKILVRLGSDRIVGATVVGPRAGELIATIALAMTNATGLRGIANTVHPYPTFGEVLRKAADAYNRTRLSPRVKRVLGWLSRIG